MAEARRRARLWLLPPLAYTKSNEHAWSAGTVWLSADDVARRARRHRPLVATTAGPRARVPQRARRQLVAAQCGQPRAAPEVRADDVPRPPGRAARSRRQGRPTPTSWDGHPRRHRRDLAHAAPASRARRHGRAPQRPGGSRRQPLRAFRRPGQLRVAVERLRPERPHRRSDRADARARQSPLRGGGRGVRCVARRDRARSRCLAADAVADPQLRVDGAGCCAASLRSPRSARSREAATAGSRSPTPTRTAATWWSTWMHDLGLDVTIDEIGNVIGTRAGPRPAAPVMTGSHIDTVRTGGPLRRQPRRARRPRGDRTCSRQRASRRADRSQSRSSPTRKARASSPT